MLNLPDDFQPKANDCVCSAHFDSESCVLSGSQRKIPTLNLGRSEDEIQQILSNHVASVIEKQVIIGLSSPASKKSNAQLADTADVALRSLEMAEARLKKPRTTIRGDVYDNLGAAINIATELCVNQGDTSISTDVVQGLSQTLLNVSIDEDEPPDDAPIIRRRKPPQTESRSEVPQIRPLSMEERSLLQSSPPPSGSRRRPHSAILAATVYRTPSPAEKRTCEQETPDYSRSKCDGCTIKAAEISALKTEIQTVRHQLLESRTARILLESRPCLQCDEKTRKINLFLKQVRRLNVRLGRMKKQERRLVTITRTEMDFSVDAMPDKRFEALFGIRKKIFKLIFEQLEKVARKAIYWEGTVNTTIKVNPTPPTRKSSNVYMNEFLLFLMRLRLKPNIELLAFIFGWSIGHISNVFNTWLDIFSRQLEWMVVLPDPITCRRLAPSHISAMFPRLRCIVDCTEIFIQKSQSAVDQAATYSLYKKHNTVKFLVVILPNGCIAYVSETWAGRTTDNFIFYHSGLLEQLKSGDQVLADRGFTIMDELMRRGIEMNIPPAATGVVQFTTENVTETRRIANVRIHVERAIGRMKTYQVLNGVLPITMVPFISKIIRSVAILMNLKDEIVH